MTCQCERAAITREKKRAPQPSEWCARSLKARDQMARLREELLKLKAKDEEFVEARLVSDCFVW